MVKLGSKLDYISGVALVREELEHAGFDTETLSNEQIAELGRRIADSPIRDSGKGTTSTARPAAHLGNREDGSARHGRR